MKSLGLRMYVCQVFNFSQSLTWPEIVRNVWARILVLDDNASMEEIAAQMHKTGMSSSTLDMLHDITTTLHAIGMPFGKTEPVGGELAECLDAKQKFAEEITAIQQAQHRGLHRGKISA
jgi:hypothetical protein